MKLIERFNEWINNWLWGCDRKTPCKPQKPLDLGGCMPGWPGPTKLEKGLQKLADRAKGESK